MRASVSFSLIAECGSGRPPVQYPGLGPPTSLGPKGPMPTQMPSLPLQALRFPRPWPGLRGVPFHGLLGWGFGDPERLVAAAQVVLAVDVMTADQLLVYGEVALFPTEFLGGSAEFRVLAVELDFDTDEADALAALVEAVKGDHDLPWEID